MQTARRLPHGAGEPWRALILLFYVVLLLLGRFLRKKGLAVS